MATNQNGYDMILHIAFGPTMLITMNTYIISSKRKFIVGTWLCVAHKNGALDTTHHIILPCIYLISAGVYFRCIKRTTNKLKTMNSVTMRNVIIKQYQRFTLCFYLDEQYIIKPMNNYKLKPTSPMHSEMVKYVYICNKSRHWGKSSGGKCGDYYHGNHSCNQDTQHIGRSAARFWNDLQWLDLHKHYSDVIII